MRHLYILVVCLLFSFPSFSSEPIKIIIPSDVYEDYKRFLNNRDPLEISDFSGVASRRDVVEVVLVQQALREGGFKQPVEFKVANAYARIQQQIESGTVAISANSLWLGDLESRSDFIYISEPSVELGEFEAGLYVISSNTNALSASKLEDVQRLTAVSNKQWTVDWNTLVQLELAQLENTVKWTNMISMIKGKRVDFLLAPFQPTEDFSFVADNTKFIPIPNLKIQLRDTRNFAISKKHAHGLAVYKAFNKGLELLKEKGVVKKAYQQSGFFNSRVTNWKIIN